MQKIRLLVGSVYGGAEYVADELEPMLAQAGYAAERIEQAAAAELADWDGDPLLVITSTTGQGDLPDNIAGLFFQLRDTLPMLSNSHYGVIALGDSSYGDTYCGGGIQFDELLTEMGAQRISDVLKIDATETMEPEEDAKAWLPQFIEQLKQAQPA